MSARSKPANGLLFEYRSLMPVTEGPMFVVTVNFENKVINLERVAAWAVVRFNEPHHVYDNDYDYDGPYEQVVGLVAGHGSGLELPIGFSGDRAIPPYGYCGSSKASLVKTCQREHPDFSIEVR